MLLTNDTTAIKYASIFKPEYIELHSTCLNVPTLQNTVLDKLSEDTKIVIGVGGSTLKEIDRAIKTFENRKIILMFGFQNYPTKYEDVNILKIRKIQSLYPNKIFGYADHTAWNEANNELITLLGAANGMSFVEKHVTNVFGQERIDFSAAISIEMFNSLNDKLKLLNQIHGDGLLKLNDGEKSYSIYGPMKLAPIARFEMKEGHIISLEDISFKRTKEKTDLSQVDTMNLMGKTLIKSISTNEILNSSHFDII